MRLADYTRSTPFRIGAAYAATFALSVVLLFGVVYWLATDEMKNGLRNAIDQDVASLMNVYRQRGEAGLRQAISDRIAGAQSDAALYLLRDGKARELGSDIDLPGQLSTGWQIRKVSPGPAGQEADGVAERFLVRGVRAGTSFFAVGRSLYAMTEVQEVLYRSLAWGLGLTAIMSIVAGFALGHGAVRRIDEINLAFREIEGGNLARRIPTRGTGDEIDRLIGNINDMLDRLGQLMANLQQVTNDIAHDLRTPLSRLRQGLEAVRMKASTTAEYEATIDRAIEQTDAILDTFGALLRIAQIESTARRGRFAPVDLAEISGRVVEAYESAIEDADQTIHAEIESAVQVFGDRDLLTQMLANLVENATRHCPAGTNIVVTLTGGPAPTLAVADTGPGIPPEAREPVLRRFYRLDGSRTAPGSGLGLALVKAVADLHGATLKLCDNQPGLRASLHFDRGKCR